MFLTVFFIITHYISKQNHIETSIYKVIMCVYIMFFFFCYTVLLLWKGYYVFVFTCVIIRLLWESFVLGWSISLGQLQPPHVFHLPLHINTMQNNSKILQLYFTLIWLWSIFACSELHARIVDHVQSTVFNLFLFVFETLCVRACVRVRKIDKKSGAFVPEVSKGFPHETVFRNHFTFTIWKWQEGFTDQNIAWWLEGIGWKVSWIWLCYRKNTLLYTIIPGTWTKANRVNLHFMRCYSCSASQRVINKPIVS